MNDTSTSYWHHTRRLTLWLSGIWLVVTFCVIFFARDLYGFKLFGWPVSFYMAAQGILLIYVAIVAVYAWQMRRLEDKAHAQKLKDATDEQ